MNNSIIITKLYGLMRHEYARLKDCTPTKDSKSEIMMKKKSPRSSSKARAETNSRNTNSIVRLK